MKKTIFHLRSGGVHLRVFAAAGAAVLALSPLFTLVLMAENAGAAQTSEAYCAQYTSNSKLNACKSGIRGEDCSDYAITFDQATSDICTKAHQDKANGLISDTPIFNPSTGGSSSTDSQTYKNAILNACTPYSNDTTAAAACLFGGLGENGTDSSPKTPQDCLSNSAFQGSATAQGACITGATAGQSYLSAKNGTTNSSNNLDSNSGSLQDILDQSKNLSKYLDTLHAVGPNSNVDVSKEADNNYGSYVNGAGKQQPLNVYKATTCATNCPALLWFNGGGWHMDDGTAYCIATGSSKKNCAPGANGDTSNAGTGQDQAPPPGGGANARGYTVIEVTYRLGSSGVYYMLEDVLRGIQHVRNNAGLYGIDANKIAIGGDSAGGSLSLRAGATGKSGAKVMVGWSAPTNAYTALFKSFSSFLIGMDHSTCIPTDLAGLTNMTDLLNGGSGNAAQYGQGLSSNDFSGLGIGGGGSSGGSDPLGLITQVLTAGQYAAKTSQNAESITQQLQSGGIQGMSGSLINLSAKKLGECLDNFKALSPALYASASSPAGFLADFDDDAIIDASQSYQMRDKLLGMGIEADAMILQGDPEAEANAPIIGAGDNHLGYDPRFVCQTINFIDHIMNKGNHPVDCAKGTGGSQQSSGCTVSTKIQFAPQKARLTVAVTNDGTGLSSSPGNGTDAQHLTGTGNTGLNGSDSTQLHYLNGGDDTIQHEVTPGNGGGSGGGGGGGGGGSGGGSGGGGSSCPSSAPSSANGGQGTPAPTGGSGSPSAPSGAGGSGSSGGSSSGSGSGLGNIGSGSGGLGNLGGGGGIGSGSTGSGSSSGSGSGSGSGSTESDGSLETTTGAIYNNTTQIGKGGDFTSTRGGGNFVANAQNANCAVDYSRAPALQQRAMADLSLCNTVIPQIEQVTGSTTYHKAPIQIMYIPTSYTDYWAPGKYCASPAQGGGGAEAFAITAAGRVYMCADVLQSISYNDYSIVHEMAHLTQRYVIDSSATAPRWLAEGIADYTRTALGYDRDGNFPTGNTYGCHSSDTYAIGYKCADALFHYIIRAYNQPNVVKNAQAAANNNNYTDSVLAAGTGKTLQQLYTECLQAECKGGASL